MTQDRRASAPLLGLRGAQLGPETPRVLGQVPVCAGGQGGLHQAAGPAEGDRAVFCPGDSHIPSGGPVRVG